jgi:hypothetical protein
VNAPVLLTSERADLSAICAVCGAPAVWGRRGFKELLKPGRARAMGTARESEKHPVAGSEERAARERPRRSDLRIHRRENSAA